MQKDSSEKYIVTGMSCAACSARIEKTVSALEGVKSCSVNLLTGDLCVVGTTPAETVVFAVKNAGYGCIRKSEMASVDGTDSGQISKKDIHRETERQLFKTLITSLVFLVPLMYLTMGVVMNGWPAPLFMKENPKVIGTAEMLLSTLVLILNRRFFMRGMKGVLNLAPNMDTLVSLGSGISWIWSTVLLIRLYSLCLTVPSVSASSQSVHQILHSLYYESAAMILVLITVGKMLEARSKGKTADALDALKKLQPETARLLTEDGEKIIPVREIMPGDRFILKPGDAVPADGIVLEGISTLDESMLTGESLPEEKRPAETGRKPERENLVCAASVNKNGRLICMAESTGEATMLSQIIKMVSDSASSKAPVARIVDKAAGVFVPVVLLISIITFMVWILTGNGVNTALNYAISVLVISCPCALGLATPVAIMVGNGVGAKNGILFKTAESLELTGKTDIAVFDKTGTLTSGVSSVAGVYPEEGITEEELVRKAAGLEAASEHPLAIAIMTYAKEKKVTPESVADFVATGSTVTGTIQGKRLTAGSRRSMAETGVDEQVLEKWDLLVNKLSSDGKTPVYFAQERKLIGIFACEDCLKATSGQAVSELKKMRIRTVLLTGDHELTGKAVAKKLGIETVFAGVLPSEKASVIESLKKNGKVLMIGDGINDAPALKTANIGMAVAEGTDIAVEACDIVLMKSDPLDVPAAIRLSKKTLKNIKQNLFWAFFYNLLCIPLAAGVFAVPFGISLTPMTGAFCMSLSSLFVVGNALRLNRASIYESKENRQKKENKMNTETIEIKGMMCPHCEARVRAALLSVDGVTDAVVSHEKGNAVISGTADRASLIEAVKSAGYEV